MKKLFYFLLIASLIFIGCNQAENQHEEKKDNTAKEMAYEKEDVWGNISEREAMELIKSFCVYSDSIKDFNSTKSVWFKKSDLKASFNKFFDSNNNGLTDTIQYDGFRIYFARYPGTWNDLSKRFQNTMVVTKTRQIGKIEDDIHEDIIEMDKGEFYVQPLNNGGRCRPNCGGTKLLEPLYRDFRKDSMQN